MELAEEEAARRWKMTIALLIGISLAALAATMLVAAGRVAPAADPDYYRNGLLYGRTPGGARNPGMAWSIRASLAGGELRVRVSDRSGTPVAGGRLVFEPDRGGGASPPLPLAESAPGIFHLPRPFAPGGELHGKLRFSRGEATASRNLVLFH